MRVYHVDLLCVHAVHFCLCCPELRSRTYGQSHKSITLWGIGVLRYWCRHVLPVIFHGNLLAGIFSSDASVITAAADYLKAYAIDCMLTAIFFCYTGFYNGIGKTKFVMIQGIIGAFGVRVPISYFMSIQPEPSLFHIGLATPMSSALQLILCLGFMYYLGTIQSHAN